VLLVFGRVAGISNLKMFLISKKQELLGLVFSLLLTNHIVQTDERKIFPEVEKDEQVIAAGSTLTLDCIQSKSSFLDDIFELRWTTPELHGLLVVIK
jgi:hypothetical protein